MAKKIRLEEVTKILREWCKQEELKHVRIIIEGEQIHIDFDKPTPEG